MSKLSFNRRSIIIALLLTCLIPINFATPIQAWSIKSHAILTTVASKILPEPWKAFFRQYEGLLNQTTAYPDTLYRQSDPKEAPRHFIDLEIWNPNDPSTGTLPQAVNEFTLKMEASIKVKNWNQMFIEAGRLAHYMADACQPYHTTVNYNPVTRDGVPLHAVLDSSLAVHFSELHLLSPSEVGTVNAVNNLTQFAFSIAVQSHSFLPIINRILIDEGLSWSPELTRIIENRTNVAMIAVAKVWVTAIVNGGASPPDAIQTAAASTPVSVGITPTTSIPVQTLIGLSVLAASLAALVLYRRRR